MGRSPSREQGVLWLRRFYAAVAPLGDPPAAPDDRGSLRYLAQKARAGGHGTLLIGAWPFRRDAEYQKFAEAVQLTGFCRVYLPHIVLSRTWRVPLPAVKAVAAQLPGIVRWITRAQTTRGTRVDLVGCSGLAAPILTCGADPTARRAVVTWTFDDAFEILRAIAQLYARYADHIRRCVECHAVFIGVRRRRYCRPRCSARGRQRRWRQHRAS